MSELYPLNFTDYAEEYLHDAPPTLKELMAEGFDPFDIDGWDALAWYQTDEEKTEGHTSAQKVRFETKFIRRYKNRVPGLYPLDEWQDELIRIVGEVLPKYNPVFDVLNNGMDPLTVSDRYGKNRKVYSTFPATQLNANVNDYAKDATDTEYESMEIGDFIEKVLALQSRYQDVDVMLLDECEGIFNTYVTMSEDWFAWPDPPVTG